MSERHDPPAGVAHLRLAPVTVRQDEAVSFAVEVLSAGPDVRVRLVGALDAASLPTFQEVVDPLVVDATTVTLDCHDLAFCDSSGLRGFMGVRNALDRPDGLRLCGASQGLRRILAITGLEALLAD